MSGGSGSSEEGSEEEGGKGREVRGAGKGRGGGENEREGVLRYLQEEGALVLEVCEEREGGESCRRICTV